MQANVLTGSFQEVARAITELAKNPSTNLNSLTGELKFLYDKIIRAQELLHGTEDYPQFVRLVEEAVARIDPRLVGKVGTVANFLGANLQKVAGVPGGCQPLNNEAISPGEGLRCLDRVYRYENGQLIEELGTGTSSKAYIYVDPQDPTLSSLRGQLPAEVADATVLDKNPPYTVLDRIGSAVQETSTGNSKTPGGGKSKGWVWLWILIMIALVAIVAYVVSKQKKLSL